jgi:cytochrome P450
VSGRRLMSDPFNTASASIRHIPRVAEFQPSRCQMSAIPIVPPAPEVHRKDLGALKLLITSTRNSLAIWPDYAFDVPFNRNKVFGIESVLINDPAGVRQIMSANATNYVRPAMTARILRPLAGRGVFLAAGSEWRRQRRLLAPAFSPFSVNLLLPHFIAAANDLVAELEGKPTPTSPTPTKLLH